MKRSDIGRMTHQHDEELVVFLIGMTINQWWRPDRWFPVFLAMPGMLAELSRDKGSGLLGYRLVLSPRGPWVVQYWSSAGALYEYASDSAAKHRPAWKNFNRRARQTPRAVGVWHETYVVERAESIYVNAPLAGLAAATQRVPITRATDRASDRLSASPPPGS